MKFLRVKIFARLVTMLLIIENNKFILLYLRTFKKLPLIGLNFKVPMKNYYM